MVELLVVCEIGRKRRGSRLVVGRQAGKEDERLEGRCMLGMGVTRQELGVLGVRTSLFALHCSHFIGIRCYLTDAIKYTVRST